MVKRAEQLTQTAFRLPPELLKRLDKLAAQRSKTTGMHVDRTNLVRMLLTSALDREEKRR